MKVCLSVNMCCVLILLKLLKSGHLLVPVLLVGLTEQQGSLGTTKDSARNLCDLWSAQVDQWAYFLWIIDLINSKVCPDPSSVAGDPSPSCY